MNELQSVQWGPGKQDECIEWLDYELNLAFGARMLLERQWRDWLLQYRPSAQIRLKSLPFEGASSYTLPITAIDVDPLFAAFMQTLHASDDIWNVQELNEKWQPVAKPMQDFLTFLDKSFLHMWDVNKRVVMETTKLGTGIYKSGWHYEDRIVHLYTEKGVWQKVRKRVSRPYVDHVSLFDFVLPPQATSHQADDQGGAAWTAERIRISPQKLKSLVNASSPLLPSVPKEQLDRILQMETSWQTLRAETIQGLDYDRRPRGAGAASFEQDTLRGREWEPGAPVTASSQPIREIELWEIHCRFPAQGDSEDDLVLWFHKGTREIIRAILLPYHHGKRPYDVIRYFPGDGFYGIGVCEQKEIFQALLSDLVNFQHDNVMLANSLGIATKNGSNIAPGEPIYPGKIWVTDGNPKDELTTFRMGEIYPDLPALISFVEGVGQRRTGISDLQAGSLQNLPSRTPASTVQSLLQEGKRRPDLTVKDMQYSGLANLGLRIIQLLQQYASSPLTKDGANWAQIAVSTLGVSEGAGVAKVIMTPGESAEYGLGVSINATSGTANKDLAQQRMQNLLALSTSLGPQLIQMTELAMKSAGTPVSVVATEVANGMATLWRRALEQSDVRDPESIVPEIPPIPPPAPIPGPPPGGTPTGGPPAGANGTPMPGASGPPPLPGMGGVPTGHGNTLQPGIGGVLAGPPP